MHLLAEKEQVPLLSIELRAFGTPWGGYFTANFTRWLPGGLSVSKWLGYPIGLEIGFSPTSC